MAFDKASNTIILQTSNRRLRTTKYIRTREEFSRWQFLIDQVWNKRFHWDPNALNSRGERGAIVPVGEKSEETLAEKRP